MAPDTGVQERETSALAPVATRSLGAAGTLVELAGVALRMMLGLLSPTASLATTIKAYSAPSVRPLIVACVPWIEALGTWVSEVVTVAPLL
jgi:hypothetical protein